MTLTYRDVEQARAEAQQSIDRADQAVRQAARLIAGRLKIAGVSPHTLDQLKRELQSYNMRTGEWK